MARGGKGTPEKLKADIRYSAERKNSQVSWSAGVDELVDARRVLALRSEARWGADNDQPRGVVLKLGQSAVQQT